MANNRMTNNRMNNKMSNSSNTSYSSYMTENTFIIATVILFFIFVGIYIYKSFRDFQKMKKKDNDNRRIKNECPDYWENVGKHKCKNVEGLGKCSKDPNNNVMDFDTEVFNHDKTGNYSKCKWAKQCDVTWSGYTNAKIC